MATEITDLPLGWVTAYLKENLPSSLDHYKGFPVINGSPPMGDTVGRGIEPTNKVQRRESSHTCWGRYRKGWDRTVLSS